MIKLVETIGLNEAQNQQENMFTENLLREENNILIKYLEE